jgi:hypothetical protein
MALFDKLYELTDEAMKALKKPIVRSRLKRQFESAFDNLTDEVFKADDAIEKAQTIASFNLENLINAKLLKENLAKAKEKIAEEFKEMFDEEINR